MKYGNWLVFFETKTMPVMTPTFVRASNTAEALAAAQKWAGEGLVIHAILSPQAAALLRDEP